MSCPVTQEANEAFARTSLLGEEHDTKQDKVLIQNRSPLKCSVSIFLQWNPDERADSPCEQQALRVPLFHTL